MRQKIWALTTRQRTPEQAFACSRSSYLRNLDPKTVERINLVRYEKSPKHFSCLPRKEVIQPHLPVRLPCYDFTPIICPALDGCSLAVSPPASGVTNFRGVTGGVYKARERIQRSVLICVY